MMQILYFTYSARERLYAHVLEHCLHDILKEFYKAEILSAKTGLGYSNISFKQALKIESLEDFFDKINKKLFIKHQKLVLSEIWNKKRNYFTLSELIENGHRSKSSLNKAKKDFYNISYEMFKSFCKKRFKLKIAKNLKDIQNINFETEHRPESKLNFNFPQKQLKKMSVIEYGWLFTVKNITEATVLSWFYDSFLDNIDKKLYQEGVSYDTEGILYKPLGNYLFVNISIIADKIAPIKFSPELNYEKFSKKKQGFIKELKKDKFFDLEDAFYQKMDWGNYMTKEERIAFIQKISHSKWSNKFDEKEAKQKIIAIVDIDN